MKNRLKKTLSVLMSAIMLSSACVFSANAAPTADAALAASVAYGLPDTIKDGAILHAWCWSFNTIKENLSLIAQSGYKSVQTSPINQVKVGENGGMQLYGNGKWYYHYQPTLYTIGNYQLGTLEEFKAMCSEADKYGIKIIVDAVVNHCSSDYGAISNEIKSIAGGAFHPTLEITNWNNRYQVTQGKLSGLYDLNTQNENVQQMILSYLKDCVAAGADGFRYDAAKHIELPDDTAENGIKYASNFWNVILDNGSEFQYGEVLQGSGDRFADYAQILNVTASDYGKNLRTDLAAGTLKTKTVNNFQNKTVDASKLVTWVESHDNYTGDGSWKQLNNQQIRQGWAVISASGDTTPLFFSRPDGSNTTNQWGNNKIGARGDSNFFHPEVTAVNHFRNAMVGEPVKRANVRDTSNKLNNKVLLIERGTKGAVVVNASNEDFVLNAATTVADGRYADEVTGETFTVENGKLKGIVKAGSVAVIYDRPQIDCVLGDTNLDGKVTIDDVTEIQSYLAKKVELSDVQLKAANVTGSGTVNIDDVTLIQMFLARRATL